VRKDTIAVPGRVKNILFIMCDQLRWDYLSCYGHPTLATPQIDGLAARGVRCTRAYVQSPICGPSRMSFYTGRYMQSHGSNWNGVPLRVGEMTMGDYYRPLGVQTVLVGKTHMTADKEGMERLGVDPKSIIGVRVSECGFDPYERDDAKRPRATIGI
jgi:arylsulfatase A-like enzyme